MSAQPSCANAVAPILLVENADTSLPGLAFALRMAGLRNRLISLPDAECAAAYLNGEGDYADREKHPLPGLMLLDVTMLKLHSPEVPLWLTPPTGRQVVVTDLSGEASPQEFAGASAFGPNAVVCNLYSPDSLQKFCEVISRTRVQGEKLSFPRAT